MYLATGVEPTKLTAPIPGCVRMPSTASLSPWTTENTPSGRPASLSRRASTSDADGSCSDGLRMNAFPPASAIGIIHSGTLIGELDGVMAGATPTGLRNQGVVP